MKVGTTLSFLVAALSAASLSLAADAPKQPAKSPMKAAGKPAANPMALAPELHQYDLFVGNWRCTGKAFASAMGPEHPTTARVTASWALGGHWLDFRYIEDKTAANPMPFSGVAHWGWDPDQKKLVAGWVDNMGGYSTQASSGWEGNTFLYLGTNHMGMGAPLNVRDTIMKKGNDQVSHSSEIEVKGAWVKLDEETCNREMMKGPPKKK